MEENVSNCDNGAELELGVESNNQTYEDNLDDQQDLKSQLEEALGEISQFKESMQRAQADLINYRRRVEEEKVELQQRANAAIILNLLTVLDDHGRSLQYIPDNMNDLESWISGIDLVYKNLEKILGSFGLSRIESEDKDFNPSEHEALLHQPTSEIEEGKIISVIREGYRLHERILRPAQVVVSKSEDEKNQNSTEGEIENPSEEENI